MRRSVLGSIAVAAAFLAGCEDGPAQPFSPAPAGAAGEWNNAGADAATADPGSQNYDSGGGGTNAVNVCTAAQQTAQWTQAFQKPLIPPFQVAGIDLSAGGTFTPVTIQDVLEGTAGQFQLCQGQSVVCDDGSGFPAYAWGPSQQVQACYDPASYQLTFFIMFPGYDGTLSFTLPKTYGQNNAVVPKAIDPTSGAAADLNFVLQIGAASTVNGHPLSGVDPTTGKSNGTPLWTANGIDPYVANQLYLGLMYTFQNTLIAVTNPNTSPQLNEMTDPNYDCLAVQKCRTSANADSSAGNFGARSVGIYFDAAESQSSDPATASEPGDMYMYPVKFEPYSLSAYNEGLDTFVSKNSDPNLLYNGNPIYGPYAPAGVLSPPGATATPFCTLYMGETFGTFTKDCVNVTGNSKTDGLSMAKLLGAQHHTNEWFQFSVVGINQNFSADKAELTDSNGQPTVLQDNVTTPNDDCVATDFYVDVRSSGPKLNDMRGDQFPAATSNGSATQTFEDQNLAGQDLHGTAAVMGYFRQLVMDGLHELGIPAIANPKSCWFNSAAVTNPAELTSAMNAFAANAPVGCTGFEQLLTPSNPQGTGVWTDTLDVTPAGYPPAGGDPTAYLPKSIFQPGDPELTFVADPVAGVGPDAYVSAPNLMQAALSQVVAIAGRGNIANIPTEAQDWRYYLQIWAQAYTKYLLNRSTNPTWWQLYNNTCGGTTCRQVDQDELFFDLNNGLDKFEYIDRSNATTLGAPVDFEYDILLLTSNTQDNNFYQRLSRAESALYTSMLTDKKATPGSNSNVNLSDLGGAPAISSWFGGGTSAYQCAINDPACTSPAAPTCSPQEYATLGPTVCPSGPGGLMADGSGAPIFTNYQGIFTGTAFSIGQTIPITTPMPYIASAIIDLPNYANPYDLTTTNTPISVLVPWVPQQAQNGFDIPINGQRTQFIQTGSLDFSGVTITTNFDYISQYDPDSGALNGGTIAAIETQDFLGYVFPCVDPSTGDILAVKMYTSATAIVNWLEQHPGAQTACNIYVKYSPYDNYPDFITSVANGVLMSVNPGAGDGPSRIGDATIFNPALLTQTQ